MKAKQEGRLPAGTLRLLVALQPGEAYAVPDPTAPESLIVRAARAGVSLGGGRFAASAGEKLAKRDLAAWVRGPGRERLEITAAGRAYLRRAGAGPGEPAFLVQHTTLSRGMVDVETERASVLIDADESPLDWLRRRKDVDGRPFLDPAASEAGERLRRDLTTASILPRVTASWDPAIDRGGSRGNEAAEFTEVTVAARQRVGRALKDVGEDFADLLIDVCGFLKGLEIVERERGWPLRSGKIVVRLALWRLAEHYGLEREARGPSASLGIRHWRDMAPAD
jgi:hypothetical protein